MSFFFLPIFIEIYFTSNQIYPFLSAWFDDFNHQYDQDTFPSPLKVPWHPFQSTPGPR